MANEQVARIVVLKQVETQVPLFYRYAARLKSRGKVVRPGDLLIEYQVDSTVPDGPVVVTDTTEIVFAQEHV